MPVVRFIQHEGDKSFRQEGGCLAILGKMSGYVRTLQVRYEEGGMSTVDELEYECMNNYSDVSAEHIPTLEKWMSMFPFMRTLLSTPSDLMENEASARFDASYSLNEVMFAMFHLRTMLYYSPRSRYIINTTSGGGVSGLSMLHTLTETYKFPFWKAYLTVMAAVGTYGTDAGYYNSNHNSRHYYNHDASCFRWSMMTMEDIAPLLRGEQPTPEYEGESIFKNNSPYTQNMSSWLSRGVRPRDDMNNMFDFLNAEIYKAAAKLTGAKAVRLNLFTTDTKRSLDYHALSQVERVLCLSQAWEATEKEFKINSEGFIC